MTTAVAPPCAPLLSSAELAEHLGVKPKTVEEWARKDEIPAVRLPNGTWRFDLATVRKVLANRAAKQLARP